MSEKIYCWTDKFEKVSLSEWENGPFATIEECVKDAESEWINGKIYIGEFSKATVDVNELEEILYDAEVHMCEQVGEVAESWNISSIRGEYASREPIYDKYNREFRQLVMDYIAEIGEEPEFFEQVDIHERWVGKKEEQWHEVQEEDR